MRAKKLSDLLAAGERGLPARRVGGIRVTGAQGQRQRDGKAE